MTSRVERLAATVTVRGVVVPVEVAVVVLACDAPGCAAEHVAAGSDEEHATAGAVAAGWTWDGGERDGCPAHGVTATER